MKRYLRLIRFSLWIIGFVFLTIFLVQYTPWHTFFSPDYPTFASAGTPVVSAIYKFRNERGLWPQYLADLSPAYLAKAPDPLEWTYNNRPTPQLIKTIKPGVFVGYDFDPTNEGWKAWGTLVTIRSLAVTQPIPPDPKLGPDDIARRALVELDRRIARESDIVDHYQTKVALLRQLRRPGEITDLLTTLAAKRPLYFWPHMALAVNELFPVEPASASAPAATLPDPEVFAGRPFDFLAPLTPATASAPAFSPNTATSPATAAVPKTYGEKFTAFVEANPSFANYFYLHTYATLLNNDPAAMLAAQKALTCPLVTTGPATPGPGGVLIETSTALDDYKPAYYAYRLATYLYRRGQYQAVVDLCNRWQVIPKTEKSFYPLRAAALLNLGKFSEAAVDIERASIADDSDRLWAQNLRALGTAVTSKNQKFAYDPGVPKPYDVFAPVEN